MNKINENRPGYKKTKVGWIPEDWSQEPFRKIAKIQEGQVAPLNKPYCDYRHIGPENIVEGSGHLVNVQTAKELGLKSGKYPFDENAIVYSKIRPNLNKVCLPRFPGICSADAYPIWTNGSGVLTEYLLYFMLSHLFVKQAVSCSMRTGMPKINRPDLNQLLTVFPPLAEQKKIAEILSTWDDAIQAQEKLIAAKKKLKKTLMQRLLTPPSKSAWKKIKLGKLFKERSEGNREDLPLLAVTRERGIIPADETGRKDSSAEDKSKYKRVAPGDIAYNTMRMWQGVSALSDSEGIVSPAYTVCIPGREIYGPFAAYLFKHLPVVHLFHRYSQGLVSDTLNLKFHNFAEIVVSIPEIPEQKKIAAALAAVDSEINILQSLTDALKKQKRGLMQQLLTGAIRVRTAKVTV